MVLKTFRQGSIMRSYIIVVLVLLVLTNISEVQSKIYKWTDENGKVHFSDKPPKNEQETKEVEIKYSNTQNTKQHSNLKSDNNAQVSTKASALENTPPSRAICKKATTNAAKLVSQKLTALYGAEHPTVKKA